MSTVDADREVGELRIVGDLPSMFLGYRSYGGGSGEIWATQAEAVEFSVHGRFSGYYYGICQALHPKRKSISILIVRGRTWGDFKTGNTVEIKAENIGRYDRTNRITEDSLLTMAQQAELHIYQNEAFVNITWDELEIAYKKEFRDLSKHFLGEKAYKQSEEFFGAYKSFIENIRTAKTESTRNW